MVRRGTHPHTLLCPQLPAALPHFSLPNPKQIGLQSHLSRPPTLPRFARAGAAPTTRQQLPASDPTFFGVLFWYAPSESSTPRSHIAVVADSQGGLREVRQFGACRHLGRQSRPMVVARRRALGPPEESCSRHRRRKGHLRCGLQYRDPWAGCGV